MQSFESRFTARASGTNVLPEYLTSVRKIIVNPAIMGSSNLKVALLSLSDPSNALRSDKYFKEICLEALQQAFATSSYPGYISVPEIDYSGNLMNDLYALRQRYSWETSYLCNALDFLIRERDGRLRTLLGLLGRGNKECDARRRMAFTTVVNSAAEKLLERHRRSNGLHGEPDDPKLTLRYRCIDFIEDMKEKAFRSVFLEPALMYFDAVNDHTAAGDVDVHGSNVYLAVLQAATGILIPRMPLLEDECKGCADTASAGLNDLTRLIQNPGDAAKPGGNLGKAYRSVIGSKPVRVKNRVRSDKFIFRASTVLDHAVAATSDRRSSKEERQHFARHYLEPFAAYFTAEALLPFLFNYCIQDDSTAHTLQKVFEQFKQYVRCNYQEEIEEEEVKSWFWDVESMPPRFIYANAQRLFAYCEITQMDAVKESIATPIGKDNSKLSSVTASATPSTAMTVVDGLELWLDATARETIELSRSNEARAVQKWKSKDGRGRVLTAEFGTPVLQEGGTHPSIEFDYDRSMRIEPPLQAIQTIISVHKFKKCRNMAAHYIFSGDDQSPFHGENDKISSGHGAWAAGAPFHEANIRLNSGVGQPTMHTIAWTDEFKVASVVMSKGSVPTDRNGNRTNRIGRDRHYHDFAGFLVEVLVWNRELSEEEVSAVESYLHSKHSIPKISLGPAATMVVDSIHSYHPDIADGIPEVFKNRIPGSAIRLQAAGCVHGGGTGLEFLRNLHNSSTAPWDKWYHCGSISSSWVEATFSGGPQVLSAYALCSANDVPARDPVRWSLEGLVCESKRWEVLHDSSAVAAGAADFTDRWQWLSFTIAQPRAVSKVRLNISQVRQVRDGVQLGHLHFFGTQLSQHDFCCSIT